MLQKNPFPTAFLLYWFHETRGFSVATQTTLVSRMDLLVQVAPGKIVKQYWACFVLFYW